jgi:7-cyano-7-deazaguanine synthase in queuosine biosynthesis
LRKIICAPENLIPKKLKKEILYFSTYSNPSRANVGSLGSTLRKDIKRAGLRPSEIVWDFNTIALSVAAADKSVNRSKSADGWTREIDLTIHLSNPDPWSSVKDPLEKTLRFLTGDFWCIKFKNGGIAPPYAKRLKYNNEDCISLLSGGIDSLAGAIDLIAKNRKPIFVSQKVRGEVDTQKRFAKKIRSKSTHFLWSHKIHLPSKEFERSTRGRSITFISFAALAASAINLQNGSPVNIYIPENGFISLNIPLNPGRIGSFSTKTTHPVYLNGIQNIWDKLDIKLKLLKPYEFNTKGEILLECRNIDLLKELINESVSCGKYRVHKMKHCGSCVPCMVRRAAFAKAKMRDKTTKGYKYQNLSTAGRNKGPNDIGAMVGACLRIKKFGIQNLISGNLSFSDQRKRKEYEDVIIRGFKEVEAFLKKQRMI